jgi:hypothetical protein
VQGREGMLRDRVDGDVDGHEGDAR